MSSIDLILVLDASGSMSGLIKDTVGGVNHFLEKQRAEPGDAYVTLHTFDDTVRTRYAARLLSKHPEPLTEADYYGGHGGSTALLDAVGRAITMYERLPVKADKTLFLIDTDGKENASREWDLEQVKKMIEAHERAGWAFVFLGSEVGAWQGPSMGVKSWGSTVYSTQGVANKYATVSANVTRVRTSGQAAAQSVTNLDWSSDDKPPDP